MQNDKKKYPTLLKSVILTYREYGFMGFYKGMFSNFGIVFTNNALYLILKLLFLQIINFSKHFFLKE